MLMLITYTYKFIIIIMLICNVTIKLLRQTCFLISSIVAYTELQRTHLYTTSLELIVRCLFKTTWFIYMLLLIGWHFWHTHQTRENPFHTVSRKHVVQPGNRSNTLLTGVNVPQLSVKSKLIINLDTDAFSTRPTCLLLYLLLVCVAHAHLFSEVKKRLV